MQNAKLVVQGSNLEVDVIIDSFDCFGLFGVLLRLDFAFFGRNGLNFVAGALVVGNLLCEDSDQILDLVGLLSQLLLLAADIGMLSLEKIVGLLGLFE